MLHAPSPLGAPIFLMLYFAAVVPPIAKLLKTAETTASQITVVMVVVILTALLAGGMLLKTGLPAGESATMGCGFWILIWPGWFGVPWLASRFIGGELQAAVWQIVGGSFLPLSLGLFGFVTFLVERSRRPRSYESVRVSNRAAHEIRQPNDSTWAYTFNCSMPWETILGCFNESSPWSWSDDRGILRTQSQAVSIQVYWFVDHSRGDNFVARLEIASSSQATRSEVNATFRKLLSKVHATNIKKVQRATELRMLRPENLRCRVRATREPDSRLWSFHLINDSLTAIDRADLVAVKYEFGNMYWGGESPDVSVADLAPGASALIWEADDPEMRTDLWFRVTYRGELTWLLFEFPVLDRQQGTMLIAHGEAMEGPPPAAHQFPQPNDSTWAYTFNCSMPRERILACFNESGPWSWSDDLGVLRTQSQAVTVQIYWFIDNSRADNFLARLEIAPSSQTTRFEVDVTFRKLLSKVHAMNVEEVRRANE